MAEADISKFLETYNDTESFPTIADVAAAVGTSIKTVQNKAGFLRSQAKSDPKSPKIIMRVHTSGVSGIYQIKNVVSGRVYIGQAVDVHKRWIVHLHHLRAGTHHCSPLQRSWKKHGESNFEFSVVENVKPDDLTAREQFHMDANKSHVSNGGFNLAPAADSALGVKYSDESKARMSAAQKGKIFSKETRAKIAASLTGNKALPSTVALRVLKLKGQKRSPEQIADIRAKARERVGTRQYEAFGKSQTLRDWAEEYKIDKGTLSNRVIRGKMNLEDALTTEKSKGKKLTEKLPHYGVITGEPLSETLIPKEKVGTRDECVADLRKIAIANPETCISRNYYRVHGKYAESVWGAWAGTFEEFKRQAGIKLSRQQHQHERHIAKHASVDHYRALSAERSSWGDRYIRENARRFKTILACSDLHDVEIDPFYLRVLIDTAKRVQPDVISLVGDIFDLPEFGKYGVDPREWDVVGRIKFAHEKILKPLREVCPNVQIDFIEGNHEARLLRQLADATPALRAVMSDLHGFTVGKLLGLEQFEINYIAKGDLGAFTKREHEKEVANNYKVYFDTVMCHHFPHARNMGMPGVNGHHHRHEVWSQFNPTFGAYEWHQMGAGHKRSASYCEGEKWHNGFTLINVDTQTKATNFDYVAVTDFAVSGGHWYYRLPAEI